MLIRLILILLCLGVVCSETPQIDVRKYENFTVPDLKFICANYVSGKVSKLCDEQLSIVCQNMTLLSTMLDASSKFPYTGLGFASRTDYGNFDQCLTVDHKYKGGRIIGKHCAMGLFIPDFLGNITDTNSFYKLAVCKPNGCTDTDFNAILSNLTNISLPLFQDRVCESIESNTNYTATDIATILLIATCVFLMICSSIFDFYLQEKQLECPNQIYLAFSIITNGKKLLHVTKQSKEQIQSLQGLRVISMMWVLAGHAMLIWSMFNVQNAMDMEDWQLKISSVYIYAAQLAVDTFFFISGFLLAYQYLKQKPKSFIDHVKTVPSMYLHRYLRLMPALAMVYLISLSLMKHFGSGPLWSVIMEQGSTSCREHWWSFFLYIQNYITPDTEEMCLGVTWYLSADMQMFLLSPLVLIPVAILIQKPNGFKASMILMCILNIIFIALPLTTKLVFRDYVNDFDTHSRLTDYFIGAMLGIFMRVRQDKQFLYMVNSKSRVIINLVIWIVVLLGMFAVFLCYREVPLHHGYESNAVYQSLMRPAWCIGLSWIVYSGYHGQGGIVNWILCRPLFQVWGRLTYCMYLLHMEIILIYFGSLRTRLYFSDYDAFYIFCGHFIITLFLSVFWTLAFESPLITIEKIIFRGDTRKKCTTQTSHSPEDGLKKDSS